MAYDFRALSPTDFEDLVRALLQKVTGSRLEAFGQGRDQGIDIRIANFEGEATVVQAKHYVETGFNGLLHALGKEKPKIARLMPERYVLATSVPMTVERKRKIQEKLDPYIHDPIDILGTEDLNQMLTSHPDIERSFYKLWITSTNVLEKILHNATFVGSEDEADRIERVVKLYVDTGSLNEALDILDKKRLLIISGAPGVGKSTLARILAWHFMSSDWKLISVESFDEASQVFEKNSKQVFFFDDFMGQIRLSSSKIDENDEKLIRFIDRVQKSKNSLFLLTSREYILKQAQYQSQKIASEKVDLRTYTLDVGVYHKAARAKVLYNHIYFSSITDKYKARLLDDRFYLNIISHKNFSPRLIESLTTAEIVETVEPDRYLEWVQSNLDNPAMLWKIPFEAHLSRQGRTLITAMFFERDGVDIDLLHKSFLNLHRRISQQNLSPMDSLDWAKAVKETEGTFVHISNGKVGFPNPSLRDFLDKALAGSEDVIHALAVARSSRGIQQVVDHIFANKSAYRGMPEALGQAGQAAARELEDTPLTQTFIWENHSYKTSEGLGVASRVVLLMRLWEFTKNQSIAESAERITRQYSLEAIGAVNFSENIMPIELLQKPDFETFPCRSAIEKQVNEQVFVRPYNDGGRPMLRDIAEMKGYLDNFTDPTLDGHVSRLTAAAEELVAEIDGEIGSCTSTTELESVRTYFDDVADLAGISADVYDELFDERRAELEEEEYQDERSDRQASSADTVQRDDSDASIISLFSTLQ